MATVSVLLCAAPAFAHGDDSLTEANAWSTWLITPDILIPTLLFALVYGVGAARRRAASERIPWWKIGAYYIGLSAVFIALQSPIDPIAERLFSIHQVQHLLLRMLGPFLIALSQPAGALVAGLPRAVRRTVLTPVVSNRAIRIIFGALAKPVTATVIFVAALYVWEYPRFHDAAVLNDAIHYTMHITMLFAGVLFWQRIFDHRPAPQGIRYGVRMMMLWIVTLSNIVLGAFTTLKSDVLYTAYDHLGRLYHFPALADEQIGGIVIWIPSSMMCLAAILVVLDMWGRRETKLEERLVGWRERASAEERPRTGDELIAQARPKNRTLAIGFSAFALTIFLAALTIGVIAAPHRGAAAHEAAPLADGTVAGG